MENKIYLCIDLKSFYASVECVERGLDPYEVNLVVADPTRHGAITLAATPAIKKLGIPSRGRIYEIPKSIEYICAPPRMALYMQYAAKIYAIFLKYTASEDIHVYSIDESFLDITPYLKLYKKSAKEIAKMIVDNIYSNTGITATVGIGTNLFLTKVALDIEAKHNLDNIGYLDEALFRQKYWHYKPLTDFWMIGKGTANRLALLGIDDMYGIAFCKPEILYRIFGINAEILIDHARGIETVTIADIKKYKPQANSLSNSQILFEDYSYQEAYLVMKEMVDSMTLQLVEKHVVTNLISLQIAYSKNIIKANGGRKKINITTNSYNLLIEEFTSLYQRVVNKDYPIRQIAISCGNVIDEYYEEYNLFTNLEELEKEKKMQETVVEIRNKYGKNAILKGINYLDKATMRKRNTLIGGHNA